MSKKNELKITVEYEDGRLEPIYKVEDTYTLYVRTRDKRVAENTYNYLKAEYKRGQQNAS